MRWLEEARQVSGCGIEGGRRRKEEEERQSKEEKEQGKKDSAKVTPLMNLMTNDLLLATMYSNDGEVFMAEPEVNAEDSPVEANAEDRPGEGEWVLCGNDCGSHCMLPNQTCGCEWVEE